MSDEMLYTLDDARRELARRECAKVGHDIEIVVQSGYPDPFGICCTRCGKFWKVVKEDDQERGEA